MLKETNDLLSVVDELTLSKPVKVPTDDGAEYAWGVGSGVDRGRFIYAGGSASGTRL